MAIRRCLLAAAALFLAAAAQAQEIRIGYVSGLSGPIADTAQKVLKVTRGYVDLVNAGGGVDGHRLQLVAKDDGYDPGKTAHLVEQAIVDDKVIALVNSAGTAPTIALIRSGLLARYQVPLVGVFSGSDALRGPGSEQIFHTRATYHDEIMKIARLASTLELHKVAVLYQQDAFGQSILKSVADAERTYRLDLVVKAGYKPGTTDFRPQAKAIEDAHPQAIFLLGVPDAAYQFMKVYQAPNGASQIYALSFVGPHALASAAGEGKARGIGISQVVPNPNASVIPLITDFEALLRSPFCNGVASSPVALEAYLNIRLLVEAIRMAGPHPSGEKLIASLRSMHNYRLGGFPIDFSGTNRSGSTFLDIAVIGAGGRLLY